MAARKGLLQPDVRVVPAKAAVHAALAQLRTPPAAGFDLSPLDDFRWHPGTQSAAPLAGWVMSAQPHPGSLARPSSWLPIKRMGMRRMPHARAHGRVSRDVGWHRCSAVCPFPFPTAATCAGPGPCRNGCLRLLTDSAPIVEVDLSRLAQSWAADAAADAAAAAQDAADGLQTAAASADVAAVPRCSAGSAALTVQESGGCSAAVLRLILTGAQGQQVCSTGVSQLPAGVPGCASLQDGLQYLPGNRAVGTGVQVGARSGRCCCCIMRDVQ